LFLLPGLLALPFWASAQWAIQLSAGTGMAKLWQKTEIHSETSNQTYAAVNWSTVLGAEFFYHVNEHLSIGTGASYAYTYYEDPVYSSEFLTEHTDLKTIQIPLNFQWTTGKKLRSVFTLGIMANINLLQHDYRFDPDYTYTYRYTPFYTGIRAGYAYVLGKRISLGIDLYEDLSAFMTEKYLSGTDPQEVVKTNHRYFYMAQIMLHYRLFGKTRQVVNR